MEIRAATEEYLAAKKNSITSKTYRWYDMFLSQFTQWCTDNTLSVLSDITVSHVQQFVAAGTTTNTHTRHHRCQVIKGFLNWCAQDEDFGVREKTVRRITMPKVEQQEVSMFTALDIDKLLKACEKMPYPHRNKAIIHMLLDTGIRASELCFDGDRPEESTGLRLEHLLLGGGSESFIYVMGKGRKVRSVGIGQETSIAMRRYLNRERGHSVCPYVFLSRNGEPLSVRMLQHFLSELGELASVSDTHAHRFRHTFSVNQLLNGTSSLVLMQLLGHSSLDSTKLYVRAMNQIQARKSATSVVDTMRRPPREKRSWQ